MMNMLALGLSTFGLVSPLAGSHGIRPALLHPVSLVSTSPVAVVMQFGRKKEVKRPEPVLPSDDVVAAFRMLGIGEDAKYEEVEEKYAQLLERYEGQTKQTIKLQVAKDKILSYRLAQRVSGAIRPEKRMGEDRRALQKKKERKLPSWIKNYIQMPTKQTLQTNLIMFTVMALVSLIAQDAATIMMGFAFVISFGRLYNRNAPPPGKDLTLSWEPLEVKTFIGTFIVTTMSLIVGGFSSLITQYLLFFLNAKAVVNTTMIYALCASCSFLKIDEFKNFNA